MAFNIANFAPIGNTSKPFTAVGTPGAPAVWSYASNDVLTAIDGANYFAGAVQHLNLYDMIYVVSDVDGTIISSLLTVNAISKSAGTVDTTDGTDISATDSD